MKRLAYAALALLALLATATLALLATLNTPPGLSFLETKLNQLAGPSVHLTGLGGTFPSTLTLQQLTLSDPTGPWLTASNIALRWSPLALAHHQLAITALSAQSLTIARRPSYPGSGNSTTPNLRLKIASLSLPSITLGQPVIGTQMVLSAQASLQNSTTLSLALRRLDSPGHLTLIGPLTAATLDLTAPLSNTTITIQGTLGWRKTGIAANLALAASTIAPLTGNKFAGPLTGQLTASPSPTGEQLWLSLEQHLTTTPPALKPLLGGTISAHSHVTLTSQGLTLQTLALTTKTASLALNGTITPQSLALTSTLNIPDITQLAPALTGHAQLHATLTGPRSNLAATLTLTGQADEPGGPKTGPFAITLTAQNLPTAPQATLTGTGLLASAPLTLKAHISCTSQTACHATISQAAWRSLTAQADLQTTKTLPVGTLDLSLGTLSDLTPLLPHANRFTGALKAHFAYAGADNLQAHLQAQNVSLPFIAGLTGSFRADGPLNALPITITAHATNLTGTPASIAASATLNSTARSVTLTRLTTSWNSLTATLQSPTLISDANGFTLQTTHLALAGGQAALGGTFMPALNATLSLQSLPLSALAKLWPQLNGLTGTGALTTQLTGSLTAPSGPLHLALSGVTLPQTAGLPPLNAQLTAQLHATSATITATLSGDDKLALTASGQLPLTATGAMSLHVNGTGDLIVLNPWLDSSSTALKGPATLALTLTGTISAPIPTGTLTITGAEAQNINAGLHLTTINAQAGITGTTLTLTSLTATSGKGTITGSGHASFAIPTWPVSATLTATNAEPIATDLLSAQTSGTLTLTGGLRSALSVSGALSIKNALINIPKSLPASVATLPITYKGAPPAHTAPPAALPTLSWDVTLTAPRNILIKGDGLNAELGGHVRLLSSGATLTPQGAFTLIRGQLTLAGKILQFTSGRVSFTGEGFIPTLDLEATTTTSTGTSTLIVGGTAEHPTITLTSSPPSPSDEVLAQLLFGQSSSSLSPFQAASLALAVAQLSGMGENLNPLGAPLDKLRSTLGLDELSVGSDATGTPTLQAGRYISPGIYVGASQSATGQGTQANVEVNLGHGLKAESSTGTTSTGAASSVGMSYQFDY